jgi:hypothetical protein
VLKVRCIPLLRHLTPSHSGRNLLLRSLPSEASCTFTFTSAFSVVTSAVALWKCQLDVRDCAKARLTHFPEEAAAAAELPPEEAAAEEEPPFEELDAAAEEDVVPENHSAFTLFPHHIFIACSAKSTGQALPNLAMLTAFPSLSRVVKRLHSPRVFTHV